MATVFEDDFNGDLSAWVENISLDPDGYNDTQCALIDASGERLRLEDLTVDPADRFYLGFWLRTSGSSATETMLVSFVSNNTIQGQLKLQNSTEIMSIWNNTFQGGPDSSPTGVVDNEWHFIEFFCHADNPGQLIVNVDDVEVLNWVGNFNPAGTNLIDEIEFGGASAANPKRIDDFYLDDAEFHGVPVQEATGRTRGMSVHRVNLTTDAAGNATAYSLNKIKGKVARVFVDIGTLADSTTTDIVVTGERTAEAVYTGTDLTVDTLADPTTAAGVYVWQERIKVVVAQGGDTKTGQIWFVVIG